MTPKSSPPPVVVDVIRELARQTQRRSVDWWAPPGEAWKREPVAPFDEMYAGYSYPAGTLTALLDNGYAELTINPGAKLGGAASFKLNGVDGTPIEHVYVNAIQDDAQIYKDLERTYYAALQQIKVREAVEAADIVHDMLDELSDDEVDDTSSAGGSITS